MGVLKFDHSNVSDQKRLVRGEHLLLARSCLRARDGAHNRRWRVLMMAGGAPAGEVTAIRELMSRAHITAVDNNQDCLSAAIEAGVDEVVHCDLADWTKTTPTATGSHGRPYSYERKRPAASLLNIEPFDILHLDLCGGANATTAQIVSTYRSKLTSGGVMILTFSYGRDVVECYREALNEWVFLSKQAATISQQERRIRVLNKLEAAGVPELMVGRLCYLFTPSELERVRSIMTYRGSEMPMCSVVYSSGRPNDRASFVQVEPGDFELAVCYPDSVNLYDCPQERIDGLRRKFAAIKASITRQEKTSDVCATDWNLTGGERR